MSRGSGDAKRGERRRSRRSGRGRESRRNERTVVVEPLSVVFAFVPRGETGGARGKEGVAERAAAELERRYPDGVRGLRAGYVLLRRGLVCMGLPRESGESAVAWTALVPRRLRLRRRVVVLRQFADSIGYACLRRGVPVEQGGCAVRRAPGPSAAELTGALTQQQLQQRDSLLARLPAEFATSPRYLLLPRGVKPERSADVHRIRERRRPAPAPVLSGLPRPRRRGLRVLAVVNLLGVLALAAMVHTEAPAVARQPGTGQAPGALDAGVTDAQARGAGTADAAVSIEVLGRTLASVDPGVRLGELHADGAAVRVRGRLSGSGGGNAEAVRTALAASGHFENV